MLNVLIAIVGQAQEARVLASCCLVATVAASSLCREEMLLLTLLLLRLVRLCLLLFSVDLVLNGLTVVIQSNTLQLCCSVQTRLRFGQIVNESKPDVFESRLPGCDASVKTFIGATECSQRKGHGRLAFELLDGQRHFLPVVDGDAHAGLVM